MASLIDDLMTILKEETGCYKLLLEMANNKKDVIIKGDLPSLQEMTTKEQELAGLLLRLEKKREQTIKDICLVTNKDVEDMTVTKLIGFLEGQESAQKALKEVVDNLAEVILPLNQANKENQQLLNQSLEFVDFTMNALQSTRSPMANDNYASGNVGSKKSPYGNAMPGTNFFDAKQ